MIALALLVTINTMLSFVLWRATKRWAWTNWLLLPFLLYCVVSGSLLAQYQINHGLIP
jgi:hypothetical protein